MHRRSRETQVTDNTNNDNSSTRAFDARKGSPFLRAKEAAFYLGLTPYTLSRMRKRGAGPRYRWHGRFIFYHIDDLDSWSTSRSP